MTSEPDPVDGQEVRAWADLCRRLEATGGELLRPPFPSGTADIAAGFDHLARQLLTWLGWSVGYSDPGSPHFMRQNDLVLQWGGPNVDNVYRHARIEPGRRYRISGRMHGCEEFVLALRAGFMHQPKWGTLAEITASSLGFGAGDDIEILLGPGDPAEGFVPIPEGVIMASVREYYFDWQAREPAAFVIECLDPDAPLHVLTLASTDRVPDPATAREAEQTAEHPAEPVAELVAEQVAGRFAEAAAGIEHSVRYWNRYLDDHRMAGTDNSFCPPIKVAKGLDAARYSFCFWDLGPDETLIIDASVPDARYWSLQTYTMHWFRSGDFANHITSLNHRQMEIASDGSIHAVLAHTDPGVPNWIDTEGRTHGMLSFRWFWGTDDPTVTTRTVPIAAVPEHLPVDTRTVDAGERAAAIAARRTHVAWRYRS